VGTYGFHVVMVVETRVSFVCLHLLFPQEVGFLYVDVDGDELIFRRELFLQEKVLQLSEISEAQ